ncbi:MAG: peptidoglycan hydrolase CwlO-like protein [Sediminicola sp.]|jgi:peptidoglycan hydrolase CwlO-like protein
MEFCLYLSISNSLSETKDMWLKEGKVFVVIFFLFSLGIAQECTLGIGGRDAETIIQVFQLNEEQVAIMNELRSALDLETSPIEEQIKQLLETHPQSTPEELTELAVKFKVLESKIVQISRSYDQRLLALFNQKQFQRYVELCHEVVRTPLKIELIPE